MRDSRALLPIVLLPVAASFAGPLAASSPVPVSPGASASGSFVESRCPTFQWAGVHGAIAYELAVFRLSDDGSDPSPVLRTSVPGDARGWTPSSNRCLDRGARYAWSLAAATPGSGLEWSAPFLFEVQAAPSLDELARAVETLERSREHGFDQLGALRGFVPEATAGESRPGEVRRRPPRAVVAGHLSSRIEGSSPVTGGPRITSAGTAPTLGSASLRVSANVALDAASNVFKDDAALLWDDGLGTTSLGRHALGVNTTGVDNTALGFRALAANTSGLFNTASGSLALEDNDVGAANTATGFRALQSNTDGSRNTAVGISALVSNTEGTNNTAVGAYTLILAESAHNNVAVGYSALFGGTGSGNTALGSRALDEATSATRNTAVGMRALHATTTGNDNIAIGYRAGEGVTTTGNNIFIGNYGQAGDAGRIRIGNSSDHDETFIAGIDDNVVAGGTAVYVTSNGELGTSLSSSRFKEDVEDLDVASAAILALRPVSFRYTRDAAGEGERPVEYGLLAEEVAEVLPQLVVYDDRGAPRTVRYHLVTTLLLAEVQRLHARLEALEARDLAAAEQRDVELERCTREATAPDS